MNMKTFKVANSSVVVLAITLFFSQVGHARIVGVRKPGTSGTVGGISGNVVVTPGRVVNEKVDIKEGTASGLCKQDPDAAVYFPLDFFKEISRDGSSLTFEQRPDNKIQVKIPATLDSCGTFKPQLYQDPSTKAVTIMMQLEDGKSYSQYISCLEEKKILVDGKIDHDSIEAKNYSEYSYVMDYSFSKEKEIKTTLKLSYGYPKAFSGKDGYSSVFGIDNDVDLPASLCMAAEKIQPGITYLNKGQDVLINELKEICKSGDAQKIADARKSIGNADALKDIADKIMSELDAGYLVAIKKDVEKITKELGKLEEKIIKERDTMDEATAKKITKQYAEKIKELDDKFLNPAIYHLDQLMTKMAEMDVDDPKKTALEEEIKKLNEEIGAFAARKNVFSNIYALMEKYALVDSAKTIEDIRLKSFLYGKVYSGTEDAKRGKPLSFDEANKKQVAGIAKFERILNDWTDQYLVGKGNLYPIQKTEKERARAYEKMNTRWQNYQTNEQTKMQKYCAPGWTGSPQNPVQCQAFQSGAQGRLARELKGREKDLRYIKGRNDKLGKMGASYASYQKRQVAEEAANEDYEPFGSSYTSYEDNFNESYPPYSGVQQPYNPMMFGMNGQMGMGPQMGNYGAYNPMMINPQMPIPPGQFQMQQSPMMMQGPQTAQMGWPSI